MRRAARRCLMSRRADELIVRRRFSLGTFRSTRPDRLWSRCRGVVARRVEIPVAVRDDDDLFVGHPRQLAPHIRGGQSGHFPALEPDAHARWFAVRRLLDQLAKGLAVLHPHGEDGYSPGPVTPRCVLMFPGTRSP